MTATFSYSDFMKPGTVFLLPSVVIASVCDTAYRAVVPSASRKPVQTLVVAFTDGTTEMLRPVNVYQRVTTEEQVVPALEKALGVANGSLLQAKVAKGDLARDDYLLKVSVASLKEVAYKKSWAVESGGKLLLAANVFVIAWGLGVLM
eukprot:TRINITY_DN26884_c0_g1_i1.p1 TRINITY_DN26884_c0_g1~~TRINITY_DN26884_c0_g1_i1.p1  ORF type:complete len:158 (+),score=24.15 TRINITY_DN26884_c0_g1_i1:33-476(+)